LRVLFEGEKIKQVQHQGRPLLTGGGYLEEEVHLLIEALHKEH